jgi:hypothetical protein
MRRFALVFAAVVCRNLVIVSVVLGLGLGLTAPGVAHAEEASLKDRLKAAKKACVVGDYKTGADKLGDLYVETNDPTLLYNQARCYEQNSQNRQAIDRFREYLRKTGAQLTPESRAEVEQHIAECKARMKEEEKTTPPTEATVVPPPAPPPSLPPTPDPAAQAPVTPPAGLNVSETAAPAQTEESPFYKKWWFWSAVGAVVVAGTVTAIFLTRGSKSACSGEESVCLGVN